MLATNHTRGDRGRHPRSGANVSTGTFNDHPFFVVDAVGFRRVGMNIGGRVRRCFTQAREAAQLAVDVGGELCVGQDRGYSAARSGRLTGLIRGSTYSGSGA